MTRHLRVKQEQIQVEFLRKYAAQGYTALEAAEKLRLELRHVVAMATRYGIVFERKPSP